MAPSYPSSSLKLLIMVFILQIYISLAASQHSEAVQDQSQLLTYHEGPLLSGKITVNLIWYGNFKPSQRSIVTDFVTSLSSSNEDAQPSVASWWKTIEKYYTDGKGKSKLSLSMGQQMSDDLYSFGKSLTNSDIAKLAARGVQESAINVVLTASDVNVDGFCMNRCGTHSSDTGSAKIGVGRRAPRFAYIWVGNSDAQCPGYCAWPFHQPTYGPQSPPLIAPNGDVGLDGMIMNLGTLLAGTVTNPFGNGYFQGPREAPLEAASACPGVYGKGAYPGYAGNLLVDSATGASYNANGDNGRKYLLPALYDPSTSECLTLV